MKKFYLIHGFESLPNRGFSPWLMTELFKKARVSATSLEMPNPGIPIAPEWVQKIREEIKEPNEDTFLVGHSLGVPAILRYLESLSDESKISAVFLVSGFASKLDESNPNSEFRKIDNFVEKSFDFGHIKKICSRFYIIHGEKDKTVPISYANKLAETLEAQFLIVKEAGHFPSSKVFELPELLDLILKELKVV